MNVQAQVGLERCEDCRFWQDAGGEAGVCRRYAPRPMVVPREADGPLPIDAAWPWTRAEDGCGEFEPRGQRAGRGLEWIMPLHAPAAEEDERAADTSPLIREVFSEALADAVMRGPGILSLDDLVDYLGLTLANPEATAWDAGLRLIEGVDDAAVAEVLAWLEGRNLKDPGPGPEFWEGREVQGELWNGPMR